MFRHATIMLDGDASFSRVSALFHLSHRGPQTIKSLAEAVTLSHAATSRLVESLVKAGLVDRRENVADRREKLVALNPTGEECINAFRVFTADAYAAQLANVPLDVRTAFSAALSDLMRHVSPIGVADTQGLGPRIDLSRKAP